MNDSGRSLVVSEQLAESSVTFDLASRCWWTAVHDRLVTNDLMRSFVVVVLDVPRDQVVKVFPENRDKVIEALRL